MAGIFDDTVVSLMSEGVLFSYRGCTLGGSITLTDTAESRVSGLFDENDNNLFYGVLIENISIMSSADTSAKALGDEAKVEFHLINAFRHCHGLSILEWSIQAANSARLHSEDMADNDYFDHISQDGRTLRNRLEAQGIDFMMAGENISAGYKSGISSHAGLVNSAGHRDNILTPGYKQLGVGTAYNTDSYYKYYFTENFFAYSL